MKNNIVTKLIDLLIIVTQKKWSKEISKKYPKHLVVTGGDTRRDSSFSALNACPKDTKNVLIHDSARPLIKSELIDKCILHLQNNDAIITSMPATDTIIRVQNNKVICVEYRKTLFMNQTPQGFKFNIIFKAQKNNKRYGTDDFSLIDFQSLKYKIIQNQFSNLKITNPEDVYLVKGLLDNKLIKI